MRGPRLPACRPVGRGAVLAIVATLCAPTAGAQEPILYPAAFFIVPDATFHGAAADMNGDGLTDALAVTYSPGTVWILHGQGQGGFLPPEGFSTGSYAGSIALGDVDEDGWTDVATGVASYQFAVLPNEQGAGLGAPAMFATGDVGVAGLALGDLDGDGHLDVVAVGPDPSYVDKVAALLGDGLGAFASPTVAPTGGDFSVAVALGDLNEDGHLDAVTANDYSDDLSVLFGDGSGGLKAALLIPTAPRPHELLLGDFNEDGHIDAGVAHEIEDLVAIMLGNGYGRLKSPTSAYSDCPFTLAAGDVNGDGHLDLAAASYFDAAVTLLYGNGAGGFLGGALQVAVGSYPGGIAIADLDQDGRQDLLTIAAGSEVTGGVIVHLGQGLGGIAPLPSAAIGGWPIDAVAADVDGDGDLDVLTTDYASDLVIAVWGDGAGALDGWLGFAAGPDPVDLIWQDVTGDGLPDAVVTNASGSTLTLLAGDGAGGLGSPVALAVGTTPSDVVSGDFDGDGDADLATAGWMSDQVVLLMGDGAGGFAVPVAIPVDPDPTDVAAGDLDSDGRDDLAVCGLSDTVTLVFGDGHQSSHGTGGLDPADVIVVDADGDGRLDVVCANSQSGTMAVLAGDGAGGLGLPVTWAAGSFPHEVEFLDASGDLEPDLLVTTGLSESFAVLRADGRGGFGPPVQYLTGYYGQRVGFGDLDGDCRPDAFVTRVLDGQVTVMRNRGTFLAAPWTDLGGALAGTAGSPLLIAAGDLVAGGCVSLTLIGAPPGAPAVLFGAAEPNAAPFMGGVLLPYPPALVVPLVADSPLVLATTLVGGLPPGAALVLQVAVSDAGAVEGVALSNALQVQLP